MKPKDQRNQTKTPAEAWRELIQAELKVGSKIGKAFEKAGFGGIDNKILTIYFDDEALAKTARGQSEPLKRKLPQELQPCTRVQVQVGTAPAQPTVVKRVSPSAGNKQLSKQKAGNPLQALNFADFGQDDKGNELSQPVLEAAVKIEKTCDSLYEKLKQRTQSLVGQDGVVLSVDFSWRVRVGGTRGFRELLLPVFHPVFGVPYIPSSSLKGAARAWAKGEGDARIKQLLGILEGTTAISAKVEFLDAFPTKPCLSVDVATPQWHWQSNKVTYKPEPHPLLSMQQPQLLIGLRPTARGTANDVQAVQVWLENALKRGIGSRVSSGYGKTLGQRSGLPCSQSYDFELWTQGMYGSEPPNKQNHWQGQSEFRPTAVRGILRYWFRAFALSLYEPTACQALEAEIFGQLSQPGKTAINVLFNDSGKQDPYRYDGKIYLEAKEEKYLNLINQVFILSSHLGGFGRGSRRPLHRLNGRMRGCDWTVDGAVLPLDYSNELWRQLFQKLKDTFQAVRSPLGAYTSDPGRPKPRYQDVLDKHAQIWLLKSPEQIEPRLVKDWAKEGNHANVRGSALTLFYGDNRFKGKNKDGIGNANVGGALEIPSFVWIKSIFANEPYQVVTVFGTDHSDRKIFVDELDKLRQEKQAILVFGEMSSVNARPKPIRR
jgi:CRISPR-associated protein Cmr6